MSYNINRTDGTLIVTVADNGVNANATTIKLIGRNLTNYGEILNENLVHMVEHFASTNVPVNPLRGQIWYSTQNSSGTYPEGLYFYNGTAWVSISSSGGGGGGGGGPFVLKTGDVMSGPLIINATAESYKAGLRSTSGIQVYGNQSTSRFIDFSSSAGVGLGRRWSILVDNTPEIGSNLGSNFSINRWSDSDTVIESVLSINRDSGVITIANNLNMSNKVINNLANPVNAQDAATKNYVDATSATKLNLSGGTMTGALTLSGAPTAANHAATKVYVDSAISAAIGEVFLVGEMKIWPTNTPPAKWLICNGAEISRTTYANLFTIIGVTYGSGNGTTTFNLPDGRGRSPLGSGTGPGLTSRSLGESGGSETHTLTVNELPAHGHPFRKSNTNESQTQSDSNGGFLSSNAANSNYPAYSGTVSATNGQQIGGTGNNQPHNNMHPFFTINYIIYTGV